MMNIRRKKILIALSIIGIALGGGFLYQSFSRNDVQIYELSLARDAQNIKDLITQDWYWLIASKKYDLDFMLTQRAAAKKDPRYIGKLEIKVLRSESTHQFIGFVAYYPESFYVGRILFLAVRPEFRGKRYAQKLLDYAVDQLRAQGSLFVRLVTRTNNLRAQAVYTRAGFVETSRDAEFVYYEKSFN